MSAMTTRIFQIPLDGLQDLAPPVAGAGGGTGVPGGGAGVVEGAPEGVVVEGVDPGGLLRLVAATTSAATPTMLRAMIGPRLIMGHRVDVENQCLV
jgi:hypothetical protein